MQTPVSNQINEYDFSALEEIQPKEFNLNDSLRELLFNALPLVGFILFIIILFSAVIPNVEEMNRKLAEIEQLKLVDAQLQERIIRIRALGEQNAKNAVLLNKINEIVPTGDTQVVKFSDSIGAQLLGHLLENTRRNIGESVLVTSLQSVEEQKVANNNAATDLPLSKIPTKFDLSGNYDNIREFFKDLYKGNDFFVVEQMSLALDPTSSKWGGDVSLVKYQFSPNKLFDPTLAYGSISEDAIINPEVINFMEQRFINNAFEEQSETLTPTPTPTLIQK